MSLEKENAAQSNEQRLQIASLRSLGLLDQGTDPESLSYDDARVFIRRTIYKKQRALKEKIPEGTLVKFPHETEVCEVTRYTTNRFGAINSVFLKRPDQKQLRVSPSVLLTAKVIGKETFVANQNMEMRKAVAGHVSAILARLYDQGYIRDLAGETQREVEHTLSALSETKDFNDDLIQSTAESVIRRSYRMTETIVENNDSQKTFRVAGSNPGSLIDKDEIDLNPPDEDLE